MSTWHWILLIVIVYLIGVKFPGIGQKALGTVGL